MQCFHVISIKLVRRLAIQIGQCVLFKGGGEGGALLELSLPTIRMVRQWGTKRHGLLTDDFPMLFSSRVGFIRACFFFDVCASE